MIWDWVMLAIKFFFLSMVAFVTSSAEIPSVLSFSYVSNSELQLTSAKILTTAYQRLGIKLNFVGLPSKRGLYQSDHGVLDGEVLRVSDIDKHYLNLYKVPVQLYCMSGIAITTYHQTQFDDINHLLKYRLAIYNGIYWQEKFIEGFNGRYSRTSSTEKQLRLLKMNRVDYALVTRSSALKLMRNKFKDSHFIEVKPMISEFYLYHFLNKKYSHLIPLITQQLQEMKESGEMADIWEKRLQHPV